MNEHTAAANYARALLELASEANELDEVGAEVGFLLSLLERERDLRIFVESPRIARATKVEVLEKSLSGKVSRHVLNFLLTVVRKGREILLLDALRQFAVLHDEFAGIVRARVTAAVELGDAELGAIRDRLARDLGKKVELELHVDERILGGFILRYEGMVADASLQSSLEAMEDRMLAVKFGSQMIHEN